MALISQNTIDEIQKIPIVDVVTKFYQGDLKRIGGTYKGLSPWSKEKTPSFYVVPAKEIFKDFSSGNGGTAINFVMLHENLSYPLAIKAIANSFGIKVEEDDDVQDPTEVEFIEKLYVINRATAKRYSDLLWNMEATHPHFNLIAAELCDTRKFTDETIIQWQIGYAPDSWNYLYKILKDTGHYQHGIELGLIKTKGENTFDVFRHRIIFPIYNERGHIVAFGGRYLPGALHAGIEDPANKPGKYYNSPESKIYLKSKVLYGLNFAIPAIRKEGYARLVEGYTDVISMHQAGFCNTVGSCGTSLTVDQVKLLKRYTTKVVVIMDGDEPGQNAADRCIDLLMDENIQVDIIPLPEGKDPDDFVKMFN